MIERHEDSGTLFSAHFDDSSSALVGNTSRAYRLPNGLIIDNDHQWTFKDDQEPIDSNSEGGILMTAFSTNTPNLTNTMQNIGTLIWAISLFKVQRPLDGNNQTRWPDLPVQALECGLYYCINRYNPTVLGSVLVEETETISDRSPSFIAAQDSGFSNEPTKSALVSRYYYGNNDVSDVRLAANGVQYNISRYAVEAIQSFFESNFAGEAFVSNQSTHSEIVEGTLNGMCYSDWNSETRNPETRNQIEYSYSPPSMQVFWSEEDIPAIFESVARSMSNAIRDGADDDANKVVTGSTGVPVTYYRIQWGWIAMHLTVFLSGLVFLIVTMVNSRRESSTALIPIWKDDALASLNFGSQLGPTFGPSDTLKGDERNGCDKSWKTATEARQFHCN